MKKDKVSFNWKHVEGTLYEITRWGSVELVVRAYGASAVLVDKHRTAMVSKKTTDIDRFDRSKWYTVDGDEIEWWDEKSGPNVKRAAPDLVLVLDEISEHQVRYIAKLIVE